MRTEYERKEYYNKKQYEKWDFDTIKALHDMIFVEGWSLGYALSYFKGGYVAFHRERKRNIFLKNLYELIVKYKHKKVKGFYDNTRY